jgi:hypothetical protein
VSFFTQNRDATHSVGLEPSTSSFVRSLPYTTLHNHMYLYTVSFLLILYLTECKLLFKALNGIKLNVVNYKVS